MINPKSPINFNRSEGEMQELLLFLIAVAGKKASTIAPRLEKFLAGKFTPYNAKLKSPFMIIRDMVAFGTLQENVDKAGFGCQNQKAKYFRSAAFSGLDLRTATLEQLMSIKGVGRKSASCFLMWTRPNQNLSALDTHLLKEMTRIKAGFLQLEQEKMLHKIHKKVLDHIRDIEIPKSTPSSKKTYDAIEKAWLEICKLVGMTSAEYDLVIWKKYSGSNPA